MLTVVDHEQHASLRQEGHEVSLAQRLPDGHVNDGGNRRRDERRIGDDRQIGKCRIQALMVVGEPLERKPSLT